MQNADNRNALLPPWQTDSLGTSNRRLSSVMDATTHAILPYAVFYGKLLGNRNFLDGNRNKIPVFSQTYRGVLQA